MRPRVVIAALLVLAAASGLFAWLLVLSRADVTPSSPTATATSAVVAAPRVTPRRTEGAARSDDDDAERPVAEGTAPVAEASGRTADGAPLAEGAGRIAAVVVDRRGAPVTHFRVTLRRQDPREVDDVGGRFTIDLPAGDVRLTVRAQRFRPREEAVTVRAGVVTSVRFVLDDGNALRGVVTSAATGKPIAGATIEGAGGRTTSDDDGAFEIASLPAERLSVTVSADGYKSLTTGGVRGDRSRDESIAVALETLGEGEPRRELIGVGLNMRHDDDDDTNYVASVFPGAPAAAVLKDGDVIASIDGESVLGVPLRQAMEHMRGEIGTTVRVDVIRDGAHHVFDIERARIALPNHR